MARMILLVDDNAMNRELLKHALEAEYEIVEAVNGEDALDVMRKKYKLLSAVLLDIVMPVMDGYELLRRMRDNVELSQLPVIMITGSVDEDSRVEALALGANDFILKPFSMDIVKHCLRNNIALHETASIVNAIQRDKLTGLYSREFFFEKAGEMIKNHESGYYTMACFDIDNFKLINDQYGAAEGDRILFEIGAQVKRDMAEYGGIGGRISADNFATLYPVRYNDTGFIRRFNSGKPEHSARRNLSFSVGRYVVTDLTLLPSAIYDRAFIAKQSIKGRYDEHLAYFDESMLASLVRNQQIINEMDAALSQRQFEVWFQPQYNHESGALIGAEALVRWRHPEKGLIPPYLFIPVFEQNGFIYELDKYVWGEACRYLRKWIDEGRDPLPVSVNLSRYDVYKSDIVEYISGLMKKYGLPVDLLRLEITESAFSKSAKQIIAVVRRFVDLGFTVEIDDFGSGYSSLNTLKDVPAQVLKLDMKFLESSQNSERGGNIVESIVRMAKWLGMSVIAEGVETIQQANYLKSIGCFYLQGYFYAKPMPAAEYEALCRGAGKEEQLLSMETVENLDNNAFWDPNSLDSLIFNSYVGGACIFEYHNGRIEVLRATDKYIEILRSGGIALEDALKLNWAEYFDAASAKAFSDALQKSLATKEEITEEFVFVGLPGLSPRVYLRTSMRVIASAGESHLIYCINENVTPQRVSEQREHDLTARFQSIMDNVVSGIVAAVPNNGAVKFLVSNERFYAMLGYTREQYDAEIKNFYQLIYPEDAPEVAQRAHEAYRSGKPAKLQYRAICRDKTLRWILAQLSTAKFPDFEQDVLISVFVDISAQKAQDEQFVFLSEMAHDLLANENIEDGVNGTLKKLMEYFDGSRAYIFEFDFERGTTSNTYEVCAGGIEPAINALQGISLDVMSFWFNAFEHHKFFAIESIEKLDESRADEKKILLDQGISSLFTVPLYRRGEIIGMVGVDDPRRPLAHLDRLATLGDYLSVMLSRRDAEQR